MRRTTIVIVAILALAAAVLPAGASSSARQGTDILGQGGTTPATAEDGAELMRSEDRIVVGFRMRTPQPGSYAYPTADMVPPGATHPPVTPGGSGMPEVFTLWAFVFNYPDLCSDAECGFDDIGDTPAKGGIYQLDGKIARSHRLELDGRIRLGQAPTVGAALDNPFGAEVHAAVAPHGKAYTGTDLGLQLNGSVGTPDFWWPAIFLPPTG